ncbi:MAG TPA: pyridoxal-phosphate dependent enzyme, partial [Fodinibius sp.]|nr:pyridoxal-phosphate dependent enzyme [Fodinibius sp.]
GKDNSKGVATHSSGNHGQAISLAAKGNGLPAHIVMPDNAPRVKVSAVRDYEANIIFCKPTQSERERVLASVVENTGAKFIHPYDDPDVIAGQGTAALELLEDYPDLDFMLTPVGGGGLLSGTAIAASGMAPNVNIIGSEPEAVNDAYLSFRSGNLHPAQKRDTVADGLKTSLSELTFACIQQHVDEIMTVTEQEIVEAMRFIWERMKIIIEPSSAVPVAVAFNHLDMRNKRAGIIISGGNLDLDTLPWQN